MVSTYSDLKRFISFISKSETSNSCQLWQGGINSSGYGAFWLQGRTVRAHRYSYELEYGEIPKGLEIDHLCRVRHCCRPSHLEAVTPKVNVRRGISPAAINAAKAFCKRGHPFTLENTILRSRDRRECKACNRFVGHMWSTKNKERKRITQQKYVQNNREKINAQRRILYAKQLKKVV